MRRTYPTSGLAECATVNEAPRSDAAALRAAELKDAIPHGRERPRWEIREPGAVPRGSERTRIT
jgi:hypothetical protein